MRQRGAPSSSRLRRHCNVHCGPAPAAAAGRAPRACTASAATQLDVLFGAVVGHDGRTVIRQVLWREHAVGRDSEHFLRRATEDGLRDGAPGDDAALTMGLYRGRVGPGARARWAALRCLRRINVGRRRRYRLLVDRHVTALPAVASRLAELALMTVEKMTSASARIACRYCAGAQAKPCHISAKFGPSHRSCRSCECSMSKITPMSAN